MYKNLDRLTWGKQVCPQQIECTKITPVSKSKKSHHLIIKQNCFHARFTSHNVSKNKHSSSLTSPIRQKQIEIFVYFDQDSKGFAENLPFVHFIPSNSIPTQNYKWLTLLFSLPSYINKKCSACCIKWFLQCI